MSKENRKKNPLNQDDALHTFLCVYVIFFCRFNNKAEFQYNIFLLLEMSVVVVVALVFFCTLSLYFYFIFLKFFSFIHCLAKFST